MEGLVLRRQGFDAIGKTPQELGFNAIEAGPEPTEFRAQIERALRGAFAGAVDTTGDKAINVTRATGTLDADVIPCLALHRFDAPRVYHAGHRIYPKSGGFIHNFPQQNLDNGRAKNTRTNRRYKQIVRCLKRLEGELVTDRKIPREYPGYLVECSFYNVPDHYFTNERTLRRRCTMASPTSGAGSERQTSQRMERGERAADAVPRLDGEARPAGGAQDGRTGLDDDLGEVDADRELVPNRHRGGRRRGARLRLGDDRHPRLSLREGDRSVSSVVIFGLLAFDRWLWRMWPFRWLHRRPVLHGTWKMSCALRTSRVQTRRSRPTS